MPEREDYYKILDVRPDASPEEVRRAYLAKAKAYHTDRLPPQVSDEVRRLAEDQMKSVNRANDVLGDPVKRQRYHAEWVRGNGPSSQPKPKPPPPPRPPVPEVDPSHMRFSDATPGKARTASFVIRNTWGPYTKIRVSNPDSWVRVTGHTSLGDDDELPWPVEIEGEGQEWKKTYFETITVSLDGRVFRAETKVRVELQTKAAPVVSEPQRGTYRAAPVAHAPPVTRPRQVPAWAKIVMGLGALAVLGLAAWGALSTSWTLR